MNGQTRHQCEAFQKRLLFENLGEPTIVRQFCSVYQDYSIGFCIISHSIKCIKHYCDIKITFITLLESPEKFLLSSIAWCKLHSCITCPTCPYKALKMVIKLQIFFSY